MSLIMRKLAWYEQRIKSEEIKSKNLNYVSKPIDEKLRQNVIRVLDKLNYSIET